MTERLDHIERPRLPWRSESLTECGLPTAGHPVISREAFVRKVKEHGKQRVAFTTCMTCWNTALRWPTWEQDPIALMRRETYMGRGETPEFRNELLAIAMLIEAHRPEFDEALEGLSQATDLAELRRRRTRKRYG